MQPEPAADVIDSGWIRSVRPPKPAHDPYRLLGTELEDERTAAGTVEPVGTLFLTNRECPFTCLMCDLWQYTTDTAVPSDAIEQQVRTGLDAVGDVDHLKLYNAGNFFDDRAIPPQARHRIAELVAGRSTLIVENHPRLVDKRLPVFQRSLDVDRFEIAMGLETSDEFLLARLNKQMTAEHFRQAAERVLRCGASVRTFILLRPPFCTEEEGVEAACASLEFAFDAGADVCVIIPTRAGNGALDILAKRGDFAAPSLESLERVVAYGIEMARGRVFADLWDVQGECPACGPARIDRLREMNHTQAVLPPVACECR